MERTKSVNRIKFILFMVITASLFMGCESRTTAFGGLNDMIVVADSSEKVAMSDTLVKYFFPGRKMPVYEPSFKYHFISVDELSNYKVRKNLLIVGTLDGRNLMSKYLLKILPGNFVSDIRNSKANFTWQNDLYAYSQNVLIFASPNLNTLIKDIKLRGPAVADLLRKKYREQLKASMFDMAEQKDFEDYFLDTYGFTVRIQHDYFIAIEDQEGGFIWLRRLDQLKEISRDLYIKYYDNADSIVLTRDWLTARRKEIASKYFKRNEEIVISETIRKETYVGAYSAMKMEGTWRTIDLMIGGPLSLYSFYVPEQNRLFIIEASVTAVGRRKTEYLNQLETMAESFHINKKELATGE